MIALDEKDEGKVDFAGLEPATFGVGTPMLSQLSQELNRESMKLVVSYPLFFLVKEGPMT